MKNSIKLKVAALGLALGMGVANTAAVASTSCSRCAYVAMQQTTTYCASIGAGSACGSVHSYIYKNFYSQCMNSCS